MSIRTDLKLMKWALKQAGERLGRMTCNDFDLKKDGGVNSPKEWKRLALEAEVANGSPEDFEEHTNLEAYRTALSNFQVPYLMQRKVELLEKNLPALMQTFHDYRHMRDAMGYCPEKWEDCAACTELFQVKGP